MFLWRTPSGRRTFGTTVEAAESSAVLAANQGLYNGFLAAGLLWGLIWYGVIGGRPIITFFLLCVVAAGVYGGSRSAGESLWCRPPQRRSQPRCCGWLKGRDPVIGERRPATHRSPPPA